MAKVHLSLVLCMVILFSCPNSNAERINVRSGKAKIGPIQVTVTRLQTGRLWCSIRFSGPVDTQGKIYNHRITINQVSDTELSSEFEVYKYEAGALILWSDTASERLGVILAFLYMTTDQVDEIIPSCDVNITRSDHRDTTTYSAFVTNCMAPIYESFIPDVTKDNKSVASRDYLDTGRQETSSVNMTTVSFNSTVMSNENVVLNSLMFRIYSYRDFPLKGLMLTYDRQYSIL